MRVNPYLNFNGECEEAFQFYAKVLGGKIEMMSPFGDTEAAGHVDPSWKRKIMHAAMRIGQDWLMGSDPPPNMYQKPQGTFVSLQLKDAAAGERIFKSLSERGQIGMPFQKTFWSEGFGMCVDRFGIGWMVNINPDA